MLPLINLRSRRTQQLLFTLTLIPLSLLILFLNYPLTSINPFNSFSSSAPSPSTEPVPLITSVNVSSLIIAAQKNPPPTGEKAENSTLNSVDKFAQKIRPPPRKKRVGGSVKESKKTGSCDIFDGKWIFDESLNPVYAPGSCPHLDYAFNCFNNGRPDDVFLKYRWQPHGCDIPRFDGKRMLEILRGKRMVFVGDSLNRNMWESLVCSLRMSVEDKKKVFEVNGKRQFRTQGFYSFKFKDYNCTIEYTSSPFLVQQWNRKKTRNETLRLDMMQASTSPYHNADFLIFNTGHWWSHHQTKHGENYFQEGEIVHGKMKVEEAYSKALNTWAKWIDEKVNMKRTQVFFSGYSASHFRGGQWNSGGSCDGETEPITDDKFLPKYPWMMSTLESIISSMKTPVVYLNISKMTGYRKDGHPSIYRQPGTERRPGLPQDCSHWCLPGVPDTWNQLLYASLLQSSNRSRTH